MNGANGANGASFVRVQKLQGLRKGGISTMEDRSSEAC